MWLKRKEKNLYGFPLIKTLRKDIYKKQIIQRLYPECYYIEIWEDDLDPGIKELYDVVSKILNEEKKEPQKLPSRIKKLKKDQECKICFRLFSGIKGLSSHLRQFHGYNTIKQLKDYYDKYIFTGDDTCPICKKNKRKFISFSHGYAATCIGPSNCRALWANLDREKLSKAQKKNCEYMKNTPSKEDSSKTIFEVKNEKWYETMMQKNLDGKTKFDLIGEKISKSHNEIDPNTGKTRATAYSKKAAITRLGKLIENNNELLTF